MSMLGRLVKATVKVAVTPLAVAADMVMIIPDSCDHNGPEHPLSRTGKLLGSAAKDISKIADENEVI